MTMAGWLETTKIDFQISVIKCSQDAYNAFDPATTASARLDEFVLD
eukprot:CAMPEP_0182839978 /NCGR_PEP_ID=MMETSP0006_2-20121128/24177_1 /TAXON_ID=97485 /ORGANISM="Prymnesium parvum, Strain Texoma1" /LENGTH=45 /DNA_ID= /DNA_START= /DNA_END= /DNA_ORIENTATION=